MSAPAAGSSTADGSPAIPVAVSVGAEGRESEGPNTLSSSAGDGAGKQEQQGKQPEGAAVPAESQWLVYHGIRQRGYKGGQKQQGRREGGGGGESARVTVLAAGGCPYDWTIPGEGTEGEGEGVGEEGEKPCAGSDAGAAAVAGERGSTGASDGGQGRTAGPLALQLHFILPSSCYATMAVRELLKTSTAVSGARKNGIVPPG